jgi:hypothetical protein
MALEDTLMIGSVGKWKQVFARLGLRKMPSKAPFARLKFSVVGCADARFEDHNHSFHGLCKSLRRGVNSAFRLFVGGSLEVINSGCFMM